MECLDLLTVQGSSPSPQFKSITSSALSFLYSPTLTSIYDYWKNHSLDKMDVCCPSNISAFLKNINLFILIGGELLYNIVLVLSYINMNPPWVYTCSPSWTPSHIPPLTIPLGHPSAPAPSILYHASKLDWQLISRMILYMFQFSQIIPPSPSPTESKRLFYTSVSLLLSHIQGYRYHLSKFHIYAIVYCIGVFLSGLLHSV